MLARGSMLELRRWPAFWSVFWSVRSCSGVGEVAWAVIEVVRGEVRTACSEEGALGNEGRAWGDRRKEFLRMPKGDVRCCYLVKKRDKSAPFGRWVGDMCMVGET